jgi:hypothetical protein
MTIPLRHRCRNPRCRMKLPAPVEIEHHAFCCRGCYERFYRNRCRVCERDLRKAGKRGDASRLYCRPPSRCAAEHRKWPEKYDFWAGPVRPPPFGTSDVRSADEMGLKIGPADDRPTAHRLRGWWWGGDGEDDHSLYDPDGLTIARIMLEADGRYHLRAPNSIPRQSWPDHDEAKRGAENFALTAMPLESRVAARVKRDNEVPHPMGSPLNRPLMTNGAISSDWRPAGDGAGVPDIPDFLLRNSTRFRGDGDRKKHSATSDRSRHPRRGMHTYPRFPGPNQGGARHLTPQKDGRPE